MLDQVFAGIAREFGAMGIGAYVDAQVISQAVVTFDDGGSIASSGEPTRRDCQVQVDVATEAMRGQNGFAEGDVRLLVIELTGGITTDDAIEVLAGAYAGVWSVAAVSADPAGIGYDCRGRRRG